MTSAFVHNVFFWLKEPLSNESKAAFEDGLKNLAKIDLIKTAFKGRPADTHREVIDNSYTYGITFIFANKSDHDKYQVHEDHQVFIDKCSSLWSKVQVYDLESM